MSDNERRLKEYTKSMARKNVCCSTCVYSYTFRMLNGENPKNHGCGHSCLHTERITPFPDGWKPVNFFFYGNWKLGILFNLEDDLFEI
jgi:hypothetical protein